MGGHPCVFAAFKHVFAQRLGRPGPPNRKDLGAGMQKWLQKNEWIVETKQS